MLRKRSRPVQKELSRGQLMADLAMDSTFPSDSAAQKPKNNTPFFSVPGLFVGLSSKGSPDSDSARSPTSPLDYKLFSNLGNSFARSPRSPGLDPKSWDSGKIGLGLVDSLSDESNKSKPCGKVLRASESRSILFGSQMRINIPSPKSHLVDSLKDASPMSLPRNFGVSPDNQLASSKFAIGSIGSELEPLEFGKIQSCSSDVMAPYSLPVTRLMCPSPKPSSEAFSSELKDSQSGNSPLFRGGLNSNNYSGSLPIPISSIHEFMGSLSASDIELSEDYTCIISHGPNPKTTHIFGDCILESHTIEALDHNSNTNKLEEELGGSPMLVNCSGALPQFPSDEFLSFCFSCKKKLEEGKDIYMYRGEKAFCSSSCRDQEILFEEKMEDKQITDSSAGSPGSSFHEEIFLPGMAAAN